MFFILNVQRNKRNSNFGIYSTVKFRCFSNNGVPGMEVKWIIAFLHFSDKNIGPHVARINARKNEKQF